MATDRCIISTGFIDRFTIDFESAGFRAAHACVRAKNPKKAQPCLAVA